MKRRNFLRATGALSLPLVGGLPGVRAAGHSLFTALLPPDSDRILVMIQLVGGNDGLNTLVPLDQLSGLQAVRSNIFQPESSLHKITPSLAFHGRLQSFQELYGNGKLGIIQNVGYPNQNRSHFRSTDIWTTGSGSAEVLTKGWMGRHLEGEFVNFPFDYPNEDRPHPPAITIGATANPTCQGTITNLSQTIRNPFNQNPITGGTSDSELPDDNYGEELGFLRLAIEQTNAYGQLIRGAAENGNSQAEYPDTELAQDLRNVARMIDGGLQTNVYVVSLGGFDTHAGQTFGDTTAGDHARLLDELGGAIAAFQEDIDQMGHGQRVLGLTFSEFGRRIRSNASRGSDHGTAAPMFLFGSCIGENNIIGDNPTVDPQVNINEGVPMQYDFRDVYGSVLRDWFAVSDSRIREVLYPDFVYLPIASNCAPASLPVTLIDFTATGAESTIELRWQTSDETDNAGFEVERSTDGREFRRIGWIASKEARIRGGVHSYELDDTDVVRDQLYYYRLKQMDYAGAFEYTSIKSSRLRGSAIGVFTVDYPYPNPARDLVNVQVFAPTDTRITYTMFNAEGRQVHRDSTAVAGRSEVVVPVRFGRLPAGVYTLRLRTDSGDTVTRRVITE